MSYLLREILGWYPRDFPMVFVTDGSHYESLGLVELLRHRCTEIYCFDASSDTETFAASIARSITLAADELGVVVELDHPEQADPLNARLRSNESVNTTENGGTKDAGQCLQHRLAATPIITGRFSYPPAGPDSRPQSGILVIGRATMDEHTPWQIQRHAAAHPFFPHDAIGDQWFDDCKFNAYTDLGRYVGRCAVKAMGELRSGIRDGLHPPSQEARLLAVTKFPPVGR